jgi:hypothetical protein
MDPQLLYWFLSFFPKKKMKYVAILLNPIVMIILLYLIYIFLKYDHKIEVGFYSCIIVGFIPQYYYLNNSRLAGLSGRGVGILLIFVIIWVLICCENSNDGTLLWMIYGVLLSILIILTNIFALQALIIYAVLMFLIFCNYYLLLMLLIGISVMLVVNKKYTISYFRGIINYWMLYKNVMANKFILSYRYSIYRDFIKEFYVVYKRNKAEFIYYVYSNSLIILFLLSSTGISIVLWIFYGADIAVLKYKEVVALKIYASSLIAFFIISSRNFRFWGEPERYVEMTNPLIVYLVVSFSITNKNMTPIMILLLYFGVVNIFQLLFYIIPNYLLKNRQNKKENLLRSQGDIINSIRVLVENNNQKKVIFFSNNQNLVKMLLSTSWNYIYYWPSVDNFDGYKFEECFIKYPYVSSVVINGLIKKNKPTHILFDSSYGDIETDEIKEKYMLIYSEEKYRLWESI